MPRPPDYKREKKLREAAQRKRNDEAQQQRAARKLLNENAREMTETISPPTKEGLEK